MNLKVQRIYDKIENLIITCPEDFSFDDLEKDAYTEVCFSGGFLETINPPGVDCDGGDGACLFSTTETVEWDTYDLTNVELHINRFLDVPVYLKCLSLDGYEPKIANKLITALDQYFENTVSQALEEKILAQAPKGNVYNFASPYQGDRKFCAHGSYYTGGNLVNQVPDEDVSLITKFTYGFDVIWFRPQDFDEELLPDVVSLIDDVFEEGDFLLFLKEEFPDYDFIQDAEVCGVIDPGSAEVTLPPTYHPTSKPTSLFAIGGGPCTSDSQCATGLACHEETSTCVCHMETNGGCMQGQVCCYSCAFLLNKPKCFDDESIRDWSHGGAYQYIWHASNNVKGLNFSSHVLSSPNCGLEPLHLLVQVFARISKMQSIMIQVSIIQDNWQEKVLQNPSHASAIRNPFEVMHVDC